MGEKSVPKIHHTLEIYGFRKYLKRQTKTRINVQLLDEKALLHMTNSNIIHGAK